MLDIEIFRRGGPGIVGVNWTTSDKVIADIFRGRVFWDIIHWIRHFSKYSKFRDKIFAETNKGIPWAVGLEKCIIRKARFWVIVYSNVITEPDPRQPDHMTNKETLKTDKCYVGYEMERNVSNEL